MRRQPKATAPEEETSTRRRGRGVTLVLAAVVVGAALLTTGWLAAGAFQSPEQIAAAASPPPPSQVVAEVTTGDLRDQINMESTVARERTAEVALPAREGSVVITKTPLPAGSPITAGAVILEINGEPVFALPGAFPLYRDLALGDSGTDVRLLQAGLSEAGFAVSVDGVLGPSTRAAIERLYRDAGYQAPSVAVTPAAPPVAKTPADGTQGDQAGPDATASPVVVVKASAFIMFNGAPAFLAAMPPVGAVAEDDALITLASGTPLAFATVTSSTAASLTPEMQALAPLPDGTTIDLTVATIGTPAEDGSVTITLHPSATPIPDEIVGTTFVVSVTRQLVAEDALIVPTRAISSRGGGDQVVLRRDADGAFSEVVVRETAALGGRSAIELEEGKEGLEPGDEVMVQ